MSQTLFICPSCGARNASGDKLCSLCGMSFTPPTQSISPQSQTLPRTLPTERPDSARFIATFFLWLLFGTFGMHRIFLGHTASGVIMLALSIVAFGLSWVAALSLIAPYLIVAILPALVLAIWWLIDLFMMCAGHLRPSDGSRIA